MIRDIKNAILYYMLSSSFTVRENVQRPAAQFYIETLRFYALAMNL